MKSCSLLLHLNEDKGYHVKVNKSERKNTITKKSFTYLKYKQTKQGAKQSLRETGSKIMPRGQGSVVTKKSYCELHRTLAAEYSAEQI